MEKKIVENGVHDYTEADSYRYPTQPEVLKHLHWFRGLKLGFMMHWAPCCQLGTFESWPLSDGDGDWARKDLESMEGEALKEMYWNTNRTFQPVHFKPEDFAVLAKECGFRYLLFTTKHHDGFCMFDTETTDYKITAPDCPFHTSPYADVTASLYEAFRKEGLAISVYFSKPDWHNDDYWHKDFGPAPTRNVNYRIADHPELWDRFVDYTHRQLWELGSKYGKIDVLWLDGGWVRPNNQEQDIRLSEIVGKLRETTQPHLIVSDRTVGGEFENFVTPEKNVPDHVIPIPWETCIPLGNHFSFHYTDNYKSGRELVRLLLDVVSKGGNLALNLTPQPNGLLPEPAIRSVRELGAWLSVFGVGIYETQLQKPYFTGNLKYTGKAGAVYAFYLYDAYPKLPGSMTLQSEKCVLRVTSLRTGQNLPFHQEGDSVTVKTGEISMVGAQFAEGFEMATEKEGNGRKA